MPLPLSSETTIVRSMIFEVSALKNVEYIYRSHQTISSSYDFILCIFMPLKDTRLVDEVALLLIRYFLLEYRKGSLRGVCR